MSDMNYLGLALNDAAGLGYALLARPEKAADDKPQCIQAGFFSDGPAMVDMLADIVKHYGPHFVTLVLAVSGRQSPQQTMLWGEILSCCPGYAQTVFIKPTDDTLQDRALAGAKLVAYRDRKHLQDFERKQSEPDLAGLPESTGKCEGDSCRI